MTSSRYLWLRLPGLAGIIVGGLLTIDALFFASVGWQLGVITCDYTDN